MVRARTGFATPTPSRSLGKGVSLIGIQHQLGHTNLGIASIYTHGIDLTEIIETVDARRPPMEP